MLMICTRRGAEEVMKGSGQNLDVLMVALTGFHDRLNIKCERKRIQE